MRLITTTHITSAILAAALVVPMAAWSQTASTTTAAAEPATSRQAKVEARIADMYATLHITKAEDAAWNQFAQVMLDNAQAMDATISKSDATEATKTAEDILKGYAVVAQQHAENVQKLSAAFGTLYDSLTPEQKKQADEMFRAKAAAHEEKKSG
jgi:hypothetical protein